MNREWIRSEYLKGSWLSGPLGSDELERARFFIDTMEAYISESETEEVKKLEERTKGLSDDARDEFWQWHYPIHWQDIFGVRIRSAFFAQLCSYAEALLGDISHRVAVISRTKIEARHFKGGTLEAYQLYLSAIGGFTNPTESTWNDMKYLFRIRNAHIHQQGYSRDLANDAQFKKFVSGLPNIGTDNDFIELKSGSCARPLELVEGFEKALAKEYEVFRKRNMA